MQLDCNVLSGLAFRTLFERELNAEQLRGLLAEAQSLSVGDLYPRTHRDLLCFDWQRDGVSYTAGLQNATLLFVSMRPVAGQLSARELFACLGAPERYQSWYDSYLGTKTSSLQVALIFPAHAAIVYCSQLFDFAAEKPPAIDDTVPVSMISYFGTHWGEDERVFDNSSPWLGDWAGIEIQTHVHEAPPISDRDQAADVLPVTAVDGVLDEIRRAFADAPRPPDDELLHPDAHDDTDIQALMGIPHWRDLPDTSVEYEYSALAFLSPAGFRHFLPAYMSWVLRHPDSGAAVVGSTIYSLSPVSEEALRAFMLSKFSLLTPAQRAAVVSFLRLMANFEDVQVALDYWYPRPASPDLPDHGPL